MDTDFSENAPKQLAERGGDAYSPFKQPGIAVRPQPPQLTPWLNSVPARRRCVAAEAASVEVRRERRVVPVDW